jgi:hypothetical protein
VVSAPLGLVDLAARADAVSVRFAFLEACRLGYFDRREVDRCFRRIEGRRGATKLRPLLALWVPELARTRSVLEGLFLLAWVAHGGRLPRVNERWAGFEVDCCWPDERLAVELDGRGYHADPLARRRDIEKDRALRGAGYRVVRFTYRQVRDGPDAVVREVSRLLVRPGDWA